MTMAPNKTTSEEQRYRSGDRGAGAGPIVGAAVFVGFITACALVLSYHGLFQLAEYGGHEGSAFAHVFPVSYALLVLMAFWVSYVLRSAPPRDRLWVDVGLIPLLILTAGATMAARNLGFFDPQVEGALLSERAANVIVAVAPLAALLIAILLWITVRAHMRRRHQSAVPRPRPSADRTTVLPGRRPTGEGAEPAPLKSRLLDLGQSPRDDAPGEDRVDTEHLPAVGATDGDQDTEPADTGALPDPEPAEGPSARPEEEPRPADASSAPDPEHGPADGQEAGARAEAAPGPTAPLPRRSGGGNPIKRAAEETPVVPGASRPRDRAPAAEEGGEGTGPRPTGVPAPGPDEGFEHQPPVGDPATDEAEAPAVPEHGASAPAPVPEKAPDVSAGTGEEDLRPVPAAVDGPSVEESSGEDGPDGTDLWEPPQESDLWEPPSEETGGVLDDYVPPVWTPPEDDGPAAEHVPDSADAPDEAEEHVRPVPALDHDTGPEDRAAFGRSADAPPDRARPGSEHQETRESGSRDLPAPCTEPAGTTEPADEETAGEETGHRTAGSPRQDPPPPASSRSSPAAQDRDALSLDKRPMVLKPRRPPMPDLSSGPPSRRVRSEPMRPED